MQISVPVLLHPQPCHPVFTTQMLRAIPMQPHATLGTFLSPKQKLSNKPNSGVVLSISIH